MQNNLTPQQKKEKDFRLYSLQIYVYAHLHNGVFTLNRSVQPINHQVVMCGACGHI